MALAGTKSGRLSLIRALTAFSDVSTISNRRGTAQFRVGVLVPTLNAGPHWIHWADALRRQTAPIYRTLIIDSGSVDETRDIVTKAGFELVQISTTAFDHGGTRQLGVELLDDCDIIVCMTQDALLANECAISELVQIFHDQSIGAAWGRQLPHTDATPIAAHARYFNYPANSRVVSRADIPDLGIKAAFASNSFCAWRRSALMACGGFPKKILLAEDMFCASRMLLSGWRIAYVASAAVFHSHNYDISTEFRRSFDIGVFHSLNPSLLSEFGEAGSEGIKFLKSEYQFLSQNGIAAQLMGVMRCIVKYGGYRLGRNASLLPDWGCRLLSLHKNWWSPTG